MVFIYIFNARYKELLSTIGGFVYAMLFYEQQIIEIYFKVDLRSIIYKLNDCFKKNFLI